LAPSRTLAFWGLLAGAAVVLLVVGGVAGWLLSRRDQAQSQVPPVAGADQTESRREAEPVPPAQAHPKPAADAPPAEDLTAERQLCRKNLEEIALALHHFHETHNRFPPAAVSSSEGKLLYSWRVLILPFLDEADLYKQFKLDEPWDSPHNKPLLAKMPAVFAPVAGKKEPGTTYYQVFIGPEAGFNDPATIRPQGIPGVPGPPPNPAFGGRRITDFSDGTSNTLLVVEAGEAVPWTKPADLPYSEKKPLPKLGGMFPNGFHAAFADTKVFFIPRTLDEKTLRGFITLNLGEDIFRDKILPEQPRRDKKPATEGKPVGRLLEGLQAEDASERLAAVDALTNVATQGLAGRDVDAATDGLARAVGDQDGRVRAEAIKSLRALGGTKAAPALLHALRDANSFSWTQLAQALEAFGPEAKPALVAALQDDDLDVRATADRVLQKLISREITKPGEMPQWPDALVHRRQRLDQATQWDRSHPLALEGVLTLLEGLCETEGAEPGGRVFLMRVADALGRMGPTARVALPDLLYPRLHSLAEGSRSWAETTVANLAHETPQLIPGVIDTLAPPHAEVGSGELLASLGPQAVPHLIALLQRPGGPHAAAAQALAEFGVAARPAVPALMAALRDPSPGIRGQAARALGSIGTNAIVAIPGLTRLLTESSEELQRSKATAAARRGEGQQLPRAPDDRVYTLPPADSAGPRAPYWIGSVEVLERCRLEAASALVRIDPSQRAAATPIFKSSLKSRAPDVVADAAFALVQADPTDREALEALLSRYNSPGLQDLWVYQGTGALDQRVRQLPPDAQKTLLAVATPMLKSPDQRLRYSAALTVGTLKPTEAVPVLREIVKTGNATELVAAVQLLSEMGAKAKPAFADLCQVIEKQKTDRSGWSSDLDDGRISLALTHIDPEAAVPFLLKMWRDDRPSPFFRTYPANKDVFKKEDPRALASPFRDMLASQVSQHAREALMALGPKAAAAIPSAVADLKSADDWVHEPAGQLLAKIGPAALPPLLEMTNDKEAGNRARAAHVLGLFGAQAKPALPALLKLLDDKQAAVRQEAVTALGSLEGNDKLVTPALMRAAKDPEVGVRRHAVRALGWVGADAVPVLEVALGDADADVRRGAVGALGRIGASAVTVLRGALRHKDTDVRRLAVLGLGSIDPETEGVVAGLAEAARDKDRLVRRLALSLLDRPGRQISIAVPVLAAALRDSDNQVRWTTAFVLEELGADAADAAPALAEVLADPVEQVRHQAVRALRDIGPPAQSAVPALKELLHRVQPARLRAFGDSTLMTDVVEALVRLDADPVTTLIEALKIRDTPATNAAAHGLVRLGPKAVPALLELTRGGRLDARLRALGCLGTIGQPVETVVPALEKLLKDSNDLVRRAAASALGDIGPAAKSAVPLLRSMADEADENVRQAVRRALERINR
jgi:HEAT repeat protein